MTQIELSARFDQLRDYVDAVVTLPDPAASSLVDDQHDLVEAGRLPRVGRHRVLMPVLVAVVVAVVAVSVTISIHSRTNRRPAGPVGIGIALTTSTFVTYSVTYSPSGPVSPQNPPSVSWQVDLRDVTDGHLVRTLLRGSSAGVQAATRMSDGTVLVAQRVNGSCATRLVQLDPVSGRSTLLRVLNAPTQELAISPDDSTVAYLTWSPTISPCHVPAGFAGRSADLLAITNLRTGATRTTRALWGVSWSPDGTRLVGRNDADGLTILDAAALGTIVRQLKPPADCNYGYPLWTTIGIYTDATCGLHAATVSPGSSAIDNLTQLDDRGATERSWRLPPCGGVGTLVTDASRQQVLLHLSLGFGNQGECSVQKVGGGQIEVINGPRLRTVLRVNDSNITLLAG